MQYERLGNTGVFVSRLCFGAMTFGGSGTVYEAIGGVTQEEANGLVAACLDAGVNFFDTANVYANGDSEVRLAKALGSKRKSVLVATKVRGRVGPGPNEVGLSRLHIFEQVEASLKRLNTDYIDLYQIHGFDTLTPLDETLTALDDLVRQGKVRYLGCSNLAGWQIMKARGISERRGLENFVTVQSYYSLAGRDIEREIIPVLKDQGMGLLPWSPLAGGLLTGKFTRSGTADPGARRNSFDFPPVPMEKAYEIVDVLQAVGGHHHSTVAQTALAWLLHQPHVTSVVIGAKKLAQLKENLAAVDVKLSADDLDQLDKVSRLPAEYPGWMLDFQAAERVPGAIRDWSKLKRS